MKVNLDLAPNQITNLVRCHIVAILEKTDRDKDPSCETKNEDLLGIHNELVHALAALEALMEEKGLLEEEIDAV